MCYAIKFNRGEDVAFTETLLDASGNRRNLTGAKVWFEAAPSVGASVTLTRANTAAGGDDTQIAVLAQSGATLGQCVLSVPRALTLAMTARAYDCAWWIEVAGGQRTLLKRGTMLVTQSVGETTLA